MADDDRILNAHIADPFQRHIRGGALTVGQETSAAAGLAERDDGRGDLLAAHAGAAPGSTEEQPESLDVDHYRQEAEPCIRKGIDTEQIQPHPGTTEASASALVPEQSQVVTVAGQDYRRPHNPDRHRNGLNGTVARRTPPFRRVATLETARLRQHLDVAEPTSDAAGRSADKISPAEGISAFLGRLLNQLSLSAWLPAAMLVGSLAVLLQLRAQPNRNLVEAVTRLINRPLGLLILLLFALILATMVTQAFEFEVIRVLEGYWGNSLVAKGISRLFVGRQRRKFYRLMHKRNELKLRAFRKTKPDLFRKQIVTANNSYVVDLIEEDLEARLANRRSVPRSGWRAKKRAREATLFPWQQFAPAHLMGRLDAVEAQIDEYPEPYRVLPTKLGNVLRAAEDSIFTGEGSELESFVLRHWDETPSALRKEHDQYRTRLDLYCMLVFIFLVLAILAPLLITSGAGYLPGTVATSFAYLVMSFVSYGAAVASARGFGTALKAIAEHGQSVKARPRRPRRT